MSNEWNNTPISEIRPEGEMQILCISKIANSYGKHLSHSSKDTYLYHNHLLLNWDKYSGKWIDSSERFFNSCDVIMWKEVLPISNKQLLKMQNKITEIKAKNIKS